MLIRRATGLDGRPFDVLVRAGRVVARGGDLTRERAEPVFDAAGGALLPGLHDHHLHLYALARARSSTPCGPPHVQDRAGLAGSLAEGAVEAGWLRGVGYHDSVAGPLERASLDRLRADVPVRVQYRTGSLWAVNSRAIEALGLDRGVDAPGVERDAGGRATGRLFRLDDWLRERLPRVALPDLHDVSRELASFGVVGVTDATPTNDRATAARLAEAQGRSELLQRVRLMGGVDLGPGCAAGEGGERVDVRAGERKLVLDDSALPDPDAFRLEVCEAHDRGRAVAVHCVTRAELVFALAAFEAAGVRPGDRIEHAGVAPDDALATLARLGLRVVTQPNFVAERGDAYRREVAPEDRPWLYRLAALEAAGIPLAGGTDAPFGEPDPWAAMRAAVERQTRGGALLGPAECLSPERALDLFTSPSDVPGGAPRTLAPGDPADLMLLDAPWVSVRDGLSSQHVRLTLRAGQTIFSA